MNLSSQDKTQLAQLGITENQLQCQLDRFKTGFPATQIHRAATVGDGILQFSQEDQDKYASKFDEIANELLLVKFTPSSGAASRMFKHLYAALDGNESDLSNQFADNVTCFPFFNQIKEAAEKDGKSIDELSSKEIIEFFLTPKALDYGHTPKALVPFHKYEKEIRTSLEEHFVEGAKYASGSDESVRLHFTISPDHMKAAKKQAHDLANKYESLYNVQYEVSFSIQEESTNTIAVDVNDQPVRLSDGRMLFRPAGHGALLENLKGLDSDIIFIKNIDNVCREELQSTTWNWKKVLAGKLIEIREVMREVFYSEISDIQVDQTYKRLNDMGVYPPEDLDAARLKSWFNRPIRVCGMVKNEGEPGGGPFWVEKNGHESLQIVEKAQVNMSDSKQAEILSHSTHFNPVDLVCCIKDPDGNFYELTDYRDDETGFISEKSLDGKPIKALELPGLWNGAMANWITLFVEVPLETFSPVKTVNDLLKPTHNICK